MFCPHPIPYQGSKRGLARQILAYFPTDVATLIEPFAGSAALSLAAASCGAAQSFRISDSNAALMDLWTAILTQSELLAEQYADLWEVQSGQEVAFYRSVRDRFNLQHQSADFLYLLARCVKASVRYNANGQFNQSADNRRRGVRPNVMRRHLLGASQLLCGRTRIFSGDYCEAIRCASPADLIYMDPPYQGVSGTRDPRYQERPGYEAFIASLEELNARGISYLVSYDGRTGMKRFGKMLPASLNLVHLELNAGRSSQATLLGRAEATYESLYLSAALVERKARQNAAPTPSV